MFDAATIGVKVAEKIRKVMPSTICPETRDRLLLAIGNATEAEARLAFADHLAEEEKANDNKAKVEKAAKESFGDLGTPGPNG